MCQWTAAATAAESMLYDKVNNSREHKQKRYVIVLSRLSVLQLLLPPIIDDQ